MQEEAAGVCDARGVIVDPRRKHSKGLGMWCGLSKELGFRGKLWDER